MQPGSPPRGHLLAAWHVAALQRSVLGILGDTVRGFGGRKDAVDVFLDGLAGEFASDARRVEPVHVRDLRHQSGIV